MTTVRDLIDDCGWTSACDGHLALNGFHYAPDSRRGDYQFLDVHSDTRRVQICVSPTGRSVRIFVDGHEVKPT